MNDKNKKTSKQTDKKQKQDNELFSLFFLLR